MMPLSDTTQIEPYPALTGASLDYSPLIYVKGGKRGKGRGNEKGREIRKGGNNGGKKEDELTLL